MAPNESSSLSVLIERTWVKLKVHPDLRGALREEVEQAELRTTLRVEAIADPDFERPSEVDDLAREVKEAKEWFGSVGFLVSPEFLDAGMNAVPEPIASRGPSKEPEVLGVATKEPRIEGDSMRESEERWPWLRHGDMPLLSCLPSWGGGDGGKILVVCHGVPWRRSRYFKQSLKADAWSLTSVAPAPGVPGPRLAYILSDNWHVKAPGQF
ncbi:hypothetical protein JB92DRAFT_2831505 [Gautieria morchelliformis]|nr:hypothetical protein JB92DRAFT_2831505 [Gautieria morchelliformis]